MTGSQIKNQLSKIIDSLVEDNIESQVASGNLDTEEVATFDRNEAIDQLIKMIEFYREDL